MGHELVWLCTDYKIDWTAISILAAIGTAVLGWAERQRRLKATAVVIGALLLVELEQLANKIVRIQNEHLPRIVAVGNESSDYVHPDDIANSDEERGSLLAALTALSTPSLEKFIDKLDTLPAEYTFEIADVLVKIEEMRLWVENADRLVKERTQVDDAKRQIGPGQNIEQVAEIAKPLPRQLWNLRKKLAAYVGRNKRLPSTESF